MGNLLEPESSSRLAGKHSENRPQFFALQEDQFTFHKSLDQASATILSELTQELVNFRYLTYEARSTPGTDSSAFPPQQEEGSNIPFFPDLELLVASLQKAHTRENQSN